jgi:hypothetical protein
MWWAPRWSRLSRGQSRSVVDPPVVDEVVVDAGVDVVDEDVDGGEEANPGRLRDWCERFGRQ